MSFEHASNYLETQMFPHNVPRVVGEHFGKREVQKLQVKVTFTKTKCVKEKHSCSEIVQHMFWRHLGLVLES